MQTGCEQMVPRIPPRWVTWKWHYEEYSKKPISLGTPFLPTVTFIYHHISGNFGGKKRIAVISSLSFALKSMRYPGELSMLW